MDGLVEFLTARLDEREKAALAVGSDRIDAAPGMWETKYLALHQPDGGTKVTAELDAELAAHIVLNDPAHVLAEVEAKREMAAEHAPSVPKGRPAMEKHCQTCATAQAWDDLAAESNCRTLRLLALPEADHPAYREEWRP